MLRLIRSAGLVIFGLATTAGHAVEPLDFSPVLDKVADGTRVVVFDEPDERGYDGMIYLGRVTASPPAREAAPDSEN